MCVQKVNYKQRSWLYCMFSQEAMSTLSLERFLHRSLHMLCLTFEGRTNNLIFSDGMCVVVGKHYVGS